MLIKRKKLIGLKGGPSISLLDVSESAKLTQIEIQRAKQEAKKIKQEAEGVLLESEKKLRAAEQNAREIIQSANSEARKIKEKVYKETLQVAKKEAEIIKNRARELLHELFEVKRETLEQAHKEIIKVALDLAEKIIKYQAPIDPGILKTQVQEAIKKATSEADRVQVFVNPSDLKSLQDSIPDMEKLFPSSVEIIPLANESVDPGSCIVETKSGQLDARFSTQLLALTNLVSHLEVKEPEIQIGEDLELLEAEPADEEDFLAEEEEKLKEELLSEEPLIHIQQAEQVFPFSSEEYNTEQDILEKSKEEEIELIPEETKIVEIPRELTKELEPKLPEKSQTVLGGKKLKISGLPERTKEETEELDRTDFEFDEDIKEKKQDIKSSSILKPKKPAQASQVSDIASEIEQSPEWKDLIEDEDEE